MIFRVVSFWSFFLIFLFTLTPSKHLIAQNKKPNIILILADDVGYEFITPNGAKLYKTPNLDTMAKRGMNLTQCYSSPVCSPSRHMLMTGKYNFRNYFFWGSMDRNQKTFGNLLSHTGYKTAIYGKWQLGGEDTSLKAFGFPNYVLHNVNSVDHKSPRYKNPKLYHNGSYFPSNLTLGKYGDDICTDSVLNFIETNKTTPFFIYYPMILAHGPYQPTPDNPDFAGWGLKDSSKTNFKYAKSMVNYMDKKIGLIINKLKEVGLDSNTLVLFTCDNGSNKHMTEIDSNGNEISGAKGHSISAGTHVPLIAYWPGTIKGGSINNNLIDFTDFLPTIADVTHNTIPTSFGTIDGISFAPILKGFRGNPREWIFNYYNPKYKSSRLKRWAQTDTYKLYDSLGYLSFYNIVKSKKEWKKLYDSLLTPDEIIVKQKLIKVLGYYAKQSPAVLNNTTISNITDTSALMGASITDIGNFTFPEITQRGTLYNTKEKMIQKKAMLLFPQPGGKRSLGPFKQNRMGLIPETEYLFAGYADNKNGRGYSPYASFITLSKRVESTSKYFSSIAGLNSVTLNWSNAKFPEKGATKYGYLIIYSKTVPSFVESPNGKEPAEIIKNGLYIKIPAQLNHPTNYTYQIKGLEKNTKYFFLLMPYTWNGTNKKTYNYFKSGAKIISATAQRNAEIINENNVQRKPFNKIFPNPTNTQFNLIIDPVFDSIEHAIVYNSKGEIVEKLNTQKGPNLIFGKNYPSGNYYLKVLQRSTEKVYKLIKLNE